MGSGRTRNKLWTTDYGEGLCCSPLPAYGRMSDTGHLSYCCKGCGLHYTETRGVVSPHFALCPRCERFNEPHTVSDGASTWIPAQPT